MIRVRMAPSPTGLLHIGTARAALFNILFARHSKGIVVLRIEDTDGERSEKAFENDIIEGLQWLGLTWDEGPTQGGSYAPYRQSERIERYTPYIQKLIDQDYAYHCFCTTDQLDAQRTQALANKQPPIYAGTCSTLTPASVAQRVEQGVPSTLRFRVKPQILRFRDLIRGELEFDTALIGDIIIAKDIRTPLYNLAVVIDDHEMAISHVIRGEDHISNTPKQGLLIQALGFQTPVYAHLPLILNDDRSKMSKRKNKVSLLEYRTEGYLPEALINFMALLGWNPGTEQEIFTLDQIIEQFSFERVSKSGAIFNLDKLQWINGYYIRALSSEELIVLTIPFLIEQGYIKSSDHDILKASEYIVVKTEETISRDTLSQYLALEQSRAKTLAQIPENIAFCLVDLPDYDPALLSWKETSTTDTRAMLSFGYDILEAISVSDFTAPSIEHILKSAILEKGFKNGSVLWPLRVALSGQSNSPGPFEIAHALGKDKTLKRIQAAISRLDG